MKGLLSWIRRLPEEVKLDGGVLGLDQGPETPEEMWGLPKRKNKNFKHSSSIHTDQWLTAIIMQQSCNPIPWNKQPQINCIIKTLPFLMSSAHANTYQSKFVDLYVERLQFALAHLLAFLGKELVGLQVSVQPVQLHLLTGIKVIVGFTHAWWTHTHMEG